MLEPEEKIQRRRERLIEKAKEYQLGTYASKFVAPKFQLMIRAENAARPSGFSPAIVRGELSQVHRETGQCACVTCGKVGPWKGNSAGGGEIESGHFIASRRMGVLFEQNNVHPQCKLCNRHLAGNQGCYELWMRKVFGQDEVDRLRQLRYAVVSFTRDQLVDMLIDYDRRLSAAKEIIEA